MNSDQILLVKKIEEYVKEKMEGAQLSIIHDFGHLKRVATGARWFVKILGGDKKEQDLAYIAGLLHDIIRPSTEKIDHAIKSAEVSRKILRLFKFSEQDIGRIVEAIKSHRQKHHWKGLLHQSTFLADKILEQMGAYVAFRRCMWIGESEDYNKFEDILRHFQKKIAQFPKKEFPRELSSLVKIQLNWPVHFLNAVKNKETWALLIAKKSYENGRTHTKSLEKLIEDYKSISKEDEKYKQEALDYIRGKKFRQFEKLLKLKGVKKQ